MEAKRKKRRIVFLWLLVIAVAVMIFCFSAQDGEESMQTSGQIVTFLLRLLIPGFDGMAGLEKEAIFEQASFFVRKAAHFSEFAMLGASLLLLFDALALRWPIPSAWIAGTLYACTDELHQMFVGDRAGMWQDVGIDSAGVLTAVLLTTLLLRWGRRKRRQA